MYSITEIEMTTKQELKIKIREVKEETRSITLEEKCMFLLSTDILYSQRLRDEIEKRMDMLGLIRRIGSENVLFRTETIRDATPEEIIAWHCGCVWDSCFKTKCLGVFAQIRNVKCPKNDGTKNPCPARDEWVKAKELLEGKEVILEVI